MDPEMVESRIEQLEERVAELERNTLSRRDGFTMEVELRGDRIVNDGDIGGGVMITPGITEDYWALRVAVSDRQAVVAFPKFNTIGIGFAVEEDDWNVNLPFSVAAEKIFEHIKRNKGDPAIPDGRCVKAIQMVKDKIVELALAGATR